MNQRKKTALMAIIINSCLTGLKFLLYIFSGSIAIIAEAWHSFSDIITSWLVYFAVKDKEDNACISNTAEPAPPSSKKIFIRIIKFFRTNMEYKISFIIGLFLVFVAIGIFRKTAIVTSSQIRSPVFSGLAFIFFSLCSFFIYRFESNVGKKENSSALISDGMHARTDMISSLLVGFSLIFYKLGINIDRLTAFVIAAFVFFIGVDILINVWKPLIKNESYSFRYRSIDFVGYIFRKEKWERLFDVINNKLFRGLYPPGFFSSIRKCFFNSLFIIGSIIYLSTCFYTVEPYQEAVIERLGKPINKESPLQPGLRIKMPWPIDYVVKINSKVHRVMNVGNVQDDNSFALLWTRDHGQEEAFLSGDNNFFYPYFTVHYTVNNVYDFYYRNKQSEELLYNIIHKVVTNIFAQKEFYEIITSYRADFEKEATNRIQEEANFLGMGIEIIGFYTKDIHPPISIADSFEDVIAAYQDKQRRINKSLGYKNKAIPYARGEAAKRLKEAEAYVVKKINHAQGEGVRFSKQQEAIRLNSDVALKRLYYNTLNNVLRNQEKIIIDPDSGVPDIWMKYEEGFNLEESYIGY